ncbi:MAG: metalloendopeptidase-like membrane protein [Rhodospirillaceae bacterium]|nr:MAG: metalloendopeptidase-like membrane protein [Rhodospirillaceae bacterium]
MHFRHGKTKDRTNRITGPMNGFNRTLFRVLLSLAASVGGSLSGGTPAKAFTPLASDASIQRPGQRSGGVPLPPRRPALRSPSSPIPPETAHFSRKVPLPPVPPRSPQSTRICDSLTSRAEGVFLAYEQMILDKGDTVIGVLRQHGVSINDANAFALALAGAMDARRVRPGDALTVLRGADQGGKREMATLSLRIPNGPRLAFRRDPDGRFVRTPHEREKKLHRRVLSMDKGPRRSLTGGGLPVSVAHEVMTVAATDPAFPAKPSRQATLTVVYESPERGEPVLRFAALHDKGREHRSYRFPLSEAKVAYLNEKGQGVAVVELSTPIDHAVEISSGWGWRTHPVLGDKRFHRGVDYRAPRGTRTLAAADGVIEDIGRRGTYGLYLRIRHTDVLSTAYAHLDGYAPHLMKGERVKKGQLIGYVGTTGLATGPHLYYEVLVDNRQVNPLDKSDHVVPVRLTDQELTRFKHYVKDTAQVIAN